MTITERISRAKHWVDTLYQTDGVYGYLKEYPGFPIGIRTSSGSFRLSGDHRSTLTGWMPVSNLTRLTVYPTNDSTRIGMDDAWDRDYNEPLLTVWREYKEGGYTYYYIRFDKFSGDNTVDVWSGAYNLWNDVKGNPPVPHPEYGLPTGPPISYVSSPSIHSSPSIQWRRKNGGGGGTSSPANVRMLIRGDYAGYPCNRYTVRHAARLGEFLYMIWGETEKASKLLRLRYDFGFTYDIYDPLFGFSTSEAEDFMFTHQAYADTPSTVERLPRGLNYYPYLSKVQINRDLYIFESHIDPLLRMLQAIHILNKYGDPYHVYDTLGDGFPKGTPLILYHQNRTPLTIAYECMSHWNGVGIGHPQDASVASGVRTAVYLALTTLLGYRYGIAEMRQTADWAAYILTNSQYAPQAGYWPLPRGWIVSEVDGVVKSLLRPPYDGAFYNLWTNTGTYSATCDKAQSLMSMITDMFGMPIEEEGPIAANIESTITMIQALRIYSHYAQGIDYPNGKLIPSSTSPPYPTTTWQFNCDGSLGASNQNTEASAYPTHPCWGWMQTHTYRFPSAYKVIAINGYLTTGPEGTTARDVNVQLSFDGTNWVNVGTVRTNDSYGYWPFTVSLSSPFTAVGLRFYCLSGYVDGSKGTVTRQV